MPYPVLPPPPPPIMSNMALAQDHYSDTSDTDLRAQSTVNVQLAQGDRSQHTSGSRILPSSTSPSSLPSLVEETEGAERANTISSTWSPEHDRSNLHQSSVETSQIPPVAWDQCLALPERFPLESSPLPAKPSFCVLPHSQSYSSLTVPPSLTEEDHNTALFPSTNSLQPPPVQATPPAQPDNHQSQVNNFNNNNVEQISLFTLNVDTSGTDTPDTEPDFNEIPVDDLHYIINTFSPQDFPPPSLQQLTKQQNLAGGEIFRISLSQNLRQSPSVTRITQTIDTPEQPLGNRVNAAPVSPIDLTGPTTRSISDRILDTEIILDTAPDINTNSLSDIPNTDNILDLDIDPNHLSDVSPDTFPNSNHSNSNIETTSDIPNILGTDTLDSSDSTLESIPDIITPELATPDIDLLEPESIPDSPVSEDSGGDFILSNPASVNPTADSDILNDSTIPATEDALEVTADRQVYDQERQSFLAEGNALMTFRGSLLKADRLRVNLLNRVVVAQGNAVLTRGSQVIRGDRLEYNLIQDQGAVSGARGEVLIPQASSDFSPEEPTPLGNTPNIPLADRLAAEQPTVTASSPGGLTVGIGFSDAEGAENRDGTVAGGVTRLRFEADEILFTSDGWEASNVRLTNDPFSPPELEVRSRRVTFRRLDENRSELRARNPRVVLDQGLQIPLFRERAIFDNRDRNPALFTVGFDQDERGGFFIERSFSPIATEDVLLTLTPQFFLQQALENDDEPLDPEDTSSWLDPDLYGLLGDLRVQFGSKTALVGRMEMTSLDLGDDVNEEDLEGSVRLRRKIFTPLGPHILTSEYSYRDRLFNGTLGFQTIQKSYGLVLTSPTIRLGDSGVDLNYQGGIQRVNANITAERINDLLPPITPENPIRLNNRTTLTRYQVAARLQRFSFLWTGTPLPATPAEGLRYTPNPVTPFIAIVPSVRGVASFYSSGDTQPIITGELSLLGQFGHFSQPFLDYLGFNVSYRRSTEGSESPFDFDRVADREVLSGGATVQLAGPIRVGFQTSINLDQDQEFDNSFILEYSRRTHGLIFTYNPDRQIGSIGFRISDFNWSGTPEPFDTGIRTVEDSVLDNS